MTGLSLAEEVALVFRLKTGCYESKTCIIMIAYVPLPNCDALSKSSEVLTEVLNIMGAWSSCLRHMNVLTLHSSRDLTTVGCHYSSVLGTWCCLVQGSSTT